MLNGVWSFATASFGCFIHIERSFKGRAAVNAETNEFVAFRRVNKSIESNSKEEERESGNGCADTARRTEIFSQGQRSQTVCQCSSVDFGTYHWLETDPARKPYSFATKGKIAGKLMVCANSGRDQRSHSFGCRCVFCIERGSPQSHLGIEKREGFSNFGSSQYQQCWRGITCHGRRCRWTLASSPPVFISAWRYSSDIHGGQTKTRIQARQCQGRFEHQQVVHRCGHLEPCVQKRDRAYEAMAAPARESGISGCSTAHSSSWSGGCTSDCGVCSRFWFHNSFTSIG